MSVSLRSGDFNSIYLRIENMSEVQVTIDCGTLVGRKCRTEGGYAYTEFLQIPYAKPPVGELRFKNPQPPEPWTGLRNATSVDENKISYQFDIITKKTKGSEDCLYLNVFTPRLHTDFQKLLPVMVYIHGGGFMMGHGILKEYSDPEFLIDRDVVIVSINYRVGIFGFLSLNIPEAPGNLGLKDQVMALRWIQNNIDKFGGDKDNVTLFGTSAGGASIEYLILTPLSKGLFHKAAVQSGSTLNPWALDNNILNLTFKAAKELGFQGNYDNIQEIYTYLMGQSTEALGNMTFKLVDPFKGKLSNFGFVPCLERDFGTGEEFLTELPYRIIKDGRFNMVAMLRGFCEYEGIAMSSIKPQNVHELIEKKNFDKFLSYELSEVDALNYNKTFTNAYFGHKNNTENGDQPAIDFFGDYDFASGIWISTKQMSKQPVPVYAYVFAYDGKLNLSKSMNKILNMELTPRSGANHGDDLGYLMRFSFNNELDYCETDILVKTRLIKMWTDFAKTGNPTPASDDLIIQWPKFSFHEQHYLKIDKELTIERKYQPERMAIFEELYEKFEK